MRKGKHIIGQCFAGECKVPLEANFKDFREQMAGSAATAAGRLLAFMEDPTASGKAIKVMLGEMPKLWDDECLIEESLQTAAEVVQDGENALKTFKGLWLCGTKHNHVFCGCDAQSAPTLRVQAATLHYYC